MAAPTSSDAPNDAKPSSIRYEYMFEDDKRPTQQLDALLRAVAAHIVSRLDRTLQTTPPV
jgi:hypothetical protein